MFFGILLLAIGLAILLNALGLFSSSVWGIFWGIFFIAIGIRMLARRGKCPICAGSVWSGRIHEKMHDRCDCDHGHKDQE